MSRALRTGRRWRDLRSLLALPLVALAAGCAAPTVPIWPIPHDGVLPLAAATSGARVREEGGALVVELRDSADRVDSRGGHAVAAAGWPVLQLRLAFPAAAPAKLWVRVVPEGSEPVVLDVPLRAAGAGEEVEAVVALSRVLGTGQRIDKVGLALPGGGTFRVHAAKIRPLSRRLALRLGAQLLSEPFAYPANVVLLAWGLTIVLVLSPWLVVRGLFSRRGDVPSRTVVLLGAGLAGAWFVLVIPSFDRQARDAFGAVSTFRDASPADVKKGSLGLDGYAMAHLVDETVPQRTPIALFRGGRPSLASWRLIASVAPRFMWNVACDAGELPPGIDVGTALAGCLALPVPVALPPPGPPAARWSADIAPAPAPWHLRGIAVELDPSSVDPFATITLSLRDGAGRTLLEKALPAAGSIMLWDVVEVPPRRHVRLEVVASTAAGEATVALRPDGIRVLRVPAGLVPISWDPAGAIVVRGERPVQGEPRPVLAREEAPSRLELLRVLAAFALLAAAGEALLRALFRGAAAPSGGERLALAWIAGGGAVTMLWHLAELLGLPAWGTTIALALLAATLGALVLGRRDARPPAASPLAPDERAMAAAASAMVALAALQAWHEPTRQWDELINWGYRAHVFHYAGPTTDAIRDYARLSPRHKAYPPGLPLVEAFTTRAMGRWDDARASLPVAIYYGAMGLLVYAAVRRAGGRRLALLYALLALLGPMARMMSHVGMADLPLGVVFLAALVALDGWRGEAATRGYLLLAGFLGALLSWIKLDGGALKLLLLGIAALRAIEHVRARPRVLLDLAAAAALAFLPLAAWNHVYRTLGLVDWVVNSGTLDPAYLRGKLELVPEIARALAADLLVADWGEGVLWGATYVFLAVVAAAAPWSLLRPAVRPWVVAVAGGVGGYALIYVVSPQGLYQLERSLDRILLHLFPAAVVLAGRLHATLLHEGRAPRGDGAP